MKNFKQLREQTSTLEEGAFIDPPTVLVLRRKAIRMFPGGQRVATYTNDNLDLDVAIPYNPEELGKHKISTVGMAKESFETVPVKHKADVLEAKLKSLSAESPKSQLDDALYNWLTSEVKENGPFHSMDLNILDDVYEDYMALTGVNESLEEGKVLRRVWITPNGPRKHDVVAQTHDKKTKTIKKNLGWMQAKMLAKKKAEKHGLSDFTPNAKTKGWDYGRHVAEEVILEATIHSLHQITKTKTPAKVMFQNGAATMVQHTTAARIMKLHSLMKPENKRKIEKLINSSPDGLKKVVDFATEHMK